MKLFLDTNVWLRFFLGNSELQHQECLKLFQAIEQGDFRPYTSSVIILEIYFMLGKFYNVPIPALWEYIDGLLEMRNITVIDKTHVHLAIALAKKTNRKISDCLIATQIPKNVTLCTYDAEMKKLYQGLVKTPGELTRSR